LGFGLLTGGVKERRRTGVARRAAEQQGVVAADVWQCSAGMSEPRPQTLCASRGRGRWLDVGRGRGGSRACRLVRMRLRRATQERLPQRRRARPRLWGSRRAGAGGGVRTRLRRRHGWERPRLYERRRARAGGAGVQGRCWRRRRRGAASERGRRGVVGRLGRGSLVFAGSLRAVLGNWG
jgi:hypothetical protein